MHNATMPGRSRLEIPRHVNDDDLLIALEQKQSPQNFRLVIMRQIAIPMVSDEFGNKHSHLAFLMFVCNLEDVVHRGRNHVAVRRFQPN
jgi:hypothetical protein